MNLKLDGKRALVMGASSGLGRAIAECLVGEGARVGICSRSEERITAAAKQMGAAAGIAVDLSRPGAGRAVVRAAIEELGGLDILVCNTGGPPKGTFLDLTAEHWLQGFQGLWLSAADAMAESLPGMKRARFGRIILVTSVAAKEPMPGLTVSNGLRAGLLGLCKSVAHEVAADGVTVNAVLPGYTDTDRLRELHLPEETMTAQVPARRLGRPEELGALVTFLASELAGYITGQAIAVDGGWLRGQ